MKSRQDAEDVSSVGLLPAMIVQKAMLMASLGLLSFSLACGSSSSSSNPPVSGNFSNASLNGQYAYSLSGIAIVPNSTSSAPFTEAGFFTADGNGHITSGTDDFAQSGKFANNPISGTYSLHNDGTGNINLNVANGSIQFGVALVSSSQFYLIETDSFANGGGSGERQDTTAFSTAPSGTFVFRIHTTISASSVGVMTIASGAITSGNEDLLTNTGLSSLTITGGTVNSPGTNGRGTLSLTNSNNTTNFAYYVVNANTLRLIQTDTGALTLGRAEKQSGGPFTNASLDGSFAFGSVGDTSAVVGGGNLRSVGVFTSGGSGTITGGNFDSVQDGSQTTNVGLTGTYSMSSAGRAMVTLNLTNGTTIQDLFWTVSPSRAFFLVNSLGKLEDGTVDQQQTTSFTNSSLNGQFAFVMDGFDSTSLVDRVGTLRADGNGNLTLNEAVNRAGVVTLPGFLPGSYSVSNNGRVSGSISSLSSNLVFYMISNTSGYSLQNDSATEISGMIGHQ